MLIYRNAFYQVLRLHQGLYEIRVFKRDRDGSDYVVWFMGHRDDALAFAASLAGRYS